MPRDIIFVTRELFPFDAGGIGRAIANFLVTASPEERRRMAVAYLGDTLTDRRFQLIYPDVQWIDVGLSQYQEVDEHGNLYPPAQAYMDHPLHAESIRIMQVLKHFEEQNGALSYIEFADWGAGGFASIQEKKLGLAFRNACLAVRLHTTDSLLCATEGRQMSEQSLVLYDMERKSLADADMVVAQLPGVAEVMRKFFDLDQAEWAARMRIHAPPVLLDSGDPVDAVMRLTLDTPIVFSSKIQHIKRPELFVRACCGFLRGRSDYRGRILLLAHAFDLGYLAEVKALIPADLTDRFAFINTANNIERQKIIGNSVCVFTTIFESFCLAAYEASMSGALCILNNSNPAFSDQSPWVDGQNCIKFNGSTSDLHRALHRAFAQTDSLVPVKLPSDPSPWLALPTIARHEDRTPLVSVLVTHFNLGAYLDETLDSVLASDYQNLELVVVDDASTEPVSRTCIQHLEEIVDERLHIVRMTENVGKRGARNVALQAARGEFVMHLDANDIIHPRFISTAVWGLVNNPAYDFVAPQTGHFDDKHPVLSTSSPQVFSILVGEARASGLHRNFFSMGTMLARKTVFDAFPYNEDLSGDVDWELCLRAVSAGRRFIVTNAVQFFRRERIGAATERSHIRQLQYHDVLRQQHMQLGKIRIPLYAIRSSGQGASPYVGETETLRAKLEAYENSEIVFATLTIARALQSRVPWMLNLIKVAARFAWQTRKRLKKV